MDRDGRAASRPLGSTSERSTEACCRICQWWRPHFEGSETGNCQRRAPFTGFLNGAGSPWAMTDMLDVCGEFALAWEASADRGDVIVNRGVKAPV